MRKTLHYVQGDNYKVNSLITHDKVRIEIESQAEDELGNSWLRSDYETTVSLIKELARNNPQSFEKFVVTLQEVEGLDEFPLRRRCRLIYFLLSAYVDWRDSRHQVFTYGGDQVTTLLYEKVYNDEPRISIDFQHIIDQLRRYEPSREQVDVWADLLGSTLKRPVGRGQVSSGIVRDAGRMRKRRQK